MSVCCFLTVYCPINAILANFGVLVSLHILCTFLLFYRTHDKFPYKSLYFAFEESGCEPLCLNLFVCESLPGIKEDRSYEVRSFKWCLMVVNENRYSVKWLIQIGFRKRGGVISTEMITHSCYLADRNVGVPTRVARERSEGARRLLVSRPSLPARFVAWNSEILLFSLTPLQI